MTDFLIEPIGGGDWDLTLELTEFGDYDFVIVGGTEATWPQLVAQRIIYAIGTWFGESAFDRSLGFPWLEGVFGRQPLDGIAALLQEHVAKVEGVDGLVDQPILELDTAARMLRIQLTAQCGPFTVPVETFISPTGQVVTP